MPILDRQELEQSPLADLHAIASELGIEGYRRLRKAELIDALMAGGEGDVARHATVQCDVRLRHRDGRRLTDAVELHVLEEVARRRGHAHDRRRSTSRSVSPSCTTSPR